MEHKRCSIKYTVSYLSIYTNSRLDFLDTVGEAVESSDIRDKLYITIEEDT